MLANELGISGHIHTLMPGELFMILATRMRSMRRLEWVPRNANIWENVDAIIMPQIEPLSGVHPYDLRVSPWEFFQEPRMIPVFAHGALTCTVIIPRHLPLQEAEIRISRASTGALLAVGDVWL